MWGDSSTVKAREKNIINASGTLILDAVKAVGSFNNFQDKWSAAEVIFSLCMLQTPVEVCWRTAGKEL